MDGIVVESDGGDTPSGLPRRNLTPQMVANALGVTKRSVLNWVKAGLPHDTRNLQGVSSPAFELEEVKSWMKRTGRGGMVKRGRPSKNAARTLLDSHAASSTSSGNSSATSEKPSNGESDDVDLWKMLREELKGPADFEQMMATLKLKYSELMQEKQADLGDAGAADKWASATKKVSSEIRALELAEQARKTFRGEYVERVKARQVLTSMGETMRSSVTTLVSKHVQAALEVLGPKISDVSEIEILRRTLADRLRSECDTELTRLCDGIERQAEALGTRH